MKNAGSCQIPNSVTVRMQYHNSKVDRKKLFHKAWFEISVGILIHNDTYSFRFWVPAPGVIVGYLCGTLLIIRGSARISLGYAVCRAAVCCHDNPLICNVGISRLRHSTCLPCQDLGLARWIVISEAIFWQRLHFARMLRLKGQSCATSIYCVWTLNPWGVELSTRVSLSLFRWDRHTHMHVFPSASHYLTHLF